MNARGWEGRYVDENQYEDQASGRSLTLRYGLIEAKPSRLASCHLDITASELKPRAGSRD